MRRLDLYLRFDRVLTEAERDRVRPLVKERATGVPVAYLVGEREFFSLPFHVDARVLVPRPETEHLVEAAVARLTGLAAPRFADVGTGSGCIAVSVLRAVPGARGYALDVAPGALEVAGTNARRHGVAERLELLEGDLLAPLRGTSAWGGLDAVLSNPPYVVRGDPRLERAVAAHEPPEALFVPGDDPLAVAQRVAEEARDALAPGGLLALELGAGSAPEAVRRLTALGYREIESVRDLAGIERVVLGRR